MFYKASKFWLTKVVYWLYHTVVIKLSNQSNFLNKKTSVFERETIVRNGIRMNFYVFMKLKTFNFLYIFKKFILSSLPCTCTKMTNGNEKIIIIIIKYIVILSQNYLKSSLSLTINNKQLRNKNCLKTKQNSLIINFLYFNIQKKFILKSISS